MYDWEFADDALTAWVRLRQASEAMEKVLEQSILTHTTRRTIFVIAKPIQHMKQDEGGSHAKPFLE